MNIYHLNRTGSIGYDEYDEFIVAAESEEMARIIASSAHADEGSDVWLNRKTVDCTLLKPEDFTESQIISSSFNAG
jgi:hypothetical protein